MLTDQEIEDIGGEHAPYVDHKFARAIESAATAPLLARIAELEKDVAHKDAYAEQLGRELANATRELEEARKVLKETGLLLHHFWCDVQMNDYSFDKLNKGIEAIDEAIKEQT